MNVQSGAITFSRGKKSGEPRPSRTLLLFPAVLSALEERIRLFSEKTKSPTSDPSDDVSNDENIHSSWLADLQVQLETVSQLYQRYQWVLSQRQNASAREAQLLFGNTDSDHLLNSGGDRRRTMASMLQAIRADMARLDIELFTAEMRFEETILGWLEANIHGLAGFARLTPGSIFRLTVKHADQKWESRIITGRQNKQFLENDTHRFHVALDYSLGIRAEEERSFGGSSGSASSSLSGSSIGSDSFLRSLVPRVLLPRNLIGTVNFDILPLISATPQLLTISLNASGSIKLHVIVKWLPPPPPSSPGSSKADQLALELKATLGIDGARSPYSNASSNSSGAATFGARTGRKFTGFSPKKGSRTVRQHKSMSLNPGDVGVLLSQIASEEVNDADCALNSDPSVVSSISPIPSMAGSLGVNAHDRHSTWSWLRNPTSPRSDTGESGTMSRSFNAPPGSGMDRVRALALHDLNSSSELPANESSDRKALPTIVEPEAVAIVSKEQSVSTSIKFKKEDLITSEKTIRSVFTVLSELRGRYFEIGDFEQALTSLRNMLLPASESSSHQTMVKSKSLIVSGGPLRTSSIRQSMRRKKNHADLQIDVSPSVASGNVNNRKMSVTSSLPGSPDDALGLASSGWPELDAAISSHIRRSLTDLERLAKVSFQPAETGAAARHSVLESLKKHTLAIRQVIVPLVSTPPSERSKLSLQIASSLLSAADSHSLWTALCQAPSRLVALPTPTLCGELTKRLSAMRSKGPTASYEPSPNHVADRIVAQMTQYYGEYSNGQSLDLISKLVSLSSVVTICDFSFYCGSVTPGLMTKIEEVAEEMRFCHSLEPRSSPLNDDAIYASALQATRRHPTPLLVHGIANATSSNVRGVIAAALRASSAEWCSALVHSMGSMFIWIGNLEVEAKQDKDQIETRLSLVSLLKMLTACPSVTSSSQILSTLATLLAHIGSNDENENVRGLARSTAVAMGDIGLAALARHDRLANGVQTVGLASPINYYSDDEDSIEEV